MKFRIIKPRELLVPIIKDGLAVNIVCGFVVNKLAGIKKSLKCNSGYSELFKQHNKTWTATSWNKIKEIDDYEREYHGYRAEDKVQSKCSKEIQEENKKRWAQEKRRQRLAKREDIQETSKIERIKSYFDIEAALIEIIDFKKQGSK